MPMKRGRRAWLAACLGAGLIATTAAQAAPKVGPATQAAQAAPSEAMLGTQAEPPPGAAHFAVTTQAAARLGQPVPTARSSVWTLHRSATQIALLKDRFEEVWTRDAQGRLSFERSFHEHGKTASYSAGELETLGVRPDWATLARFIDSDELLGLQLKSRVGQGAKLRLRLEGESGGQKVRVDWMPALQLPALIVRSGAGGPASRIELLAHATTAPADWPQPGVRSANYQRIDAADFGDMPREPVAWMSEAMDIHSGWRRPHLH